MRSRRKVRSMDIVVVVLVALAIFFALMPIITAVLLSFRPEVERSQVPTWIRDATVVSWKKILPISQTVPPIMPTLHYTLNSLVVALASTVIALILGVPAAYIFARIPFRGSNTLLTWILSLLLIPPIIVILPFFLIVGRLGMLDTLRGLIMVHTTISLPLIIWLMMLFFREIPVEYEEASMLDGAGRIRIFLRIVLPMAIHGVVTVTIIAYVFSWSDLLFSLILTNFRARTLPMGATEFVQMKHGIDWGRMYAYMVYMIAPVLALVFILHKYFLKGLLMFAGRTEVS